MEANASSRTAAAGGRARTTLVWGRSRNCIALHNLRTRPGDSSIFSWCCFNWRFCSNRILPYFPLCVSVYTVQVWHLKFSQLFDDLGHKNHIFSSSWQPWPLWFEIWWSYSKLFVSSGLILWIWVCWTQEGLFVAFFSAFVDFQKLFCSHFFARFQKKSRLRKKTNV